MDLILEDEHKSGQLGALISHYCLTIT